MKGFLILIALVGAGVGGWYGYGALTKGPDAEDFVLAPVDRGEIVATIAATGTVEPTTKVLVGSQVSGTVMKWYMDFNAPVKVGDLLLELDPERYKTEVMRGRAAIKTAEARIEEARVRGKDARREEMRLGELRKRNAASDNEYKIAQATADAADATLHAAEATLDSVKAELNSSEVDLGRTRIICPIDGVVVSRDIDAGQTVAASFQAPTLYTIASDLRKMEVQANVAESDIGKIHDGMEARFRVDAFPERRFDGRVSQVRYNPTIVDNIVTYVTIIDVENPDLLLRPGMTATVTFEVAKVANALRVPNAALRFTPEAPRASNDTRAPGPSQGSDHKPKIYRLADGKPMPVSVEIGLTDGSFTEVLGSAVADGEKIIVERRWGVGGAAGGSRGPRMPRAM